ncbi:HNH endonuclease signature motif containing protein [Nocardioides sp. zg-DK7169]|uniref:HNH endonuclease signature motif containing protein n=1 Tax=Nocardioides sp. zg-DK7169 TaxID=2736600 RepID=UPI0015524862|nr:HNH endonuclease signature motif containing protein [Nocardioides sp. zg-DK7169]NPC96513.1 DUF222 domain-containing protein [Nocardioides sp. zg-DK7169]
MDHPIRGAARELGAVLESVAGVDPVFMATADKAAALVELAAIESRVAELRLRVTAEAGDVAEAAGARDVGAWAAVATRRRRSDCAAELRVAVALTQRPVLAAGLRAGEVNVDQAGLIAAALAELPDEVEASVVEQAESRLVELAAQFDPVELRRLGRRILDVVAPEVAEAAEARRLAELEASARRRMRLGLRALGDGTTRISGRIPDASAARLAAYLHAFTNPRREEAPEAAAAQGEAAEGRVAYGRRAAQAFCQLLEVLDPGRLPIHGGDATTLVVTVSLEALRAGLGTATLGSAAPGDSHDRISAQEARRLACTAQIVPAVLGRRGEVLDLGRGSRLFSRAQRRALAVVHPRCRAEGCSIPAAWCEAHHRTPWSAGGRTDLADGVLLCSHHHHRAHDQRYACDRLANGDLRFHRRT